MICKYPGPFEENKIFVHGLNHNISRDRLELHLEQSEEFEVLNVEYGLDPEVALVTFRDKIGKRSSRMNILEIADTHYQYNERICSNLTSKNSIY